MSRPKPRKRKITLAERLRRENEAQRAAEQRLARVEKLHEEVEKATEAVEELRATWIQQEDIPTPPGITAHDPHQIDPMQRQIKYTYTPDFGQFNYNYIRADQGSGIRWSTWLDKYHVDPAVPKEPEPADTPRRNPPSKFTPASFDAKGRRFFHSATMDGEQKSQYNANALRHARPDNANLISSLTANGMHRPVIDLDFGCRLLPSTMQGHYHLYIDRDMTWLEYQRLLTGLLEAGLIERGWYDNAMREGHTLVRPPWVRKGQVVAFEGGELPSISDVSVLDVDDESAYSAALADAQRRIQHMADDLAERETQINDQAEEIARLENLLSARNTAMGWQ